MMIAVNSALGKEIDTAYMNSGSAAIELLFRPTCGW